MLTLINLIRVNKKVMRIESKLSHISENKTIVQVSGWEDEKNIGSALAEGITVEQAEDKAILRLKKRLNKINNNEGNINLIKTNRINNQFDNKNINTEKQNNNTINKEPTDWSTELTEIDSEIRRLKWDREDEIRFLNENLGYNSRSKITKYNELINYLNILKKLNSNNNILSSTNNKYTNKLIEESDLLLNELSWNHKKGREFLQKEFNVLTRKELDETQLKSFVDKLKSIRNKY